MRICAGHEFAHSSGVKLRILEEVYQDVRYPWVLSGIYRARRVDGEQPGDIVLVTRQGLDEYGYAAV